MNREQIFEKINKERRYQDSIHGTIERNPHELAGWLLIIQSRVNKCLSEYFDEDNSHMVDRLVELAAVTVAAIEQYSDENHR